MSQPHIAEALFSCNEYESGFEGYTTFRGQTCVAASCTSKHCVSTGLHGIDTAAAISDCTADLAMKIDLIKASIRPAWNPSWMEGLCTDWAMR
jgi:hypothetical protein